MKGLKKYVAMLMAVLMTVFAAGCSPVSLLGTIGAAVGVTVYVVENGEELANQYSHTVIVEESSEEESSEEETVGEESSEEEIVEEVKRNLDFDTFMMKAFVDVIKDDYVSIHIFLLEPESYGIHMDSVERSYGVIPDEAAMEKNRQMTSALMKELKSFDYDSLSKDQQASYDEVLAQLELDQAMSDPKFDYYVNVFRTGNGIHYALASVMSDWVLRSEQDVVDLIDLLGSTRDFVDKNLDYVREQQSRGLMSISVEDVTEYCWKVLDKGMDSSILRHLQKEVDDLKLGDEITESYRSQIADAFEESFLPAYRDMVDVLRELDQNGENYKRGLWAFPDGKEYYELVLQSNLGARISVEEMLTMLETKADESYSKLIKTMQKNPEALSVMMEDDNGLPFNSYDEILEVVYSKMAADYPEIGRVIYTIDNMDEEVASDSGIQAYYNLPPVDGEQINVMKVNPFESNLASVDTFVTVAHEGFPGHMYMYNYLEVNNLPELLSVSGQLAYTEGWAVYSSWQALDYLELSQDAIDVYRNYNEFVYYTLLQLDIGLHYMEWEFADFVENGIEAGLLDDDEEGNWGQYIQLQNNPAIFFPYYGGYMQFDDLQKKAMEELGSKFDLCAFNDALLQYGPVSFKIVERSVDEYIEANK